MGFPPLDRRPILEPTSVYRFVHVERPDDPELVPDFRSDQEAGKRARERQAAIPELHRGQSMYNSLVSAREAWNGLHRAAERKGQRLRIGDYIAEVELLPGRGFAIEDPGHASGHVTVWGDKERLAASVRQILIAMDPTRG